MIQVYAPLPQYSIAVDPSYPSVTHVYETDTQQLIGSIRKWSTGKRSTYRLNGTQFKYYFETAIKRFKL